MAYRFNATESVGGNIRRILAEEIDTAKQHLKGKGSRTHDQATHEARKSIKKIRAALSLSDDHGGQHKNLGKLARKLSAYRDSAVLLETFDQLQAKYGGPNDAAWLAGIRHALKSRKHQFDRDPGTSKLLHKTAARLGKMKRKLTKPGPGTDGFEAIAYGLERTYRRGKEACAAADGEETAEAFHEWRKRVKELWYQIRLLAPLWPGGVEPREETLRSLETWLGEHHDLAVLRDHFTGTQSSANKRNIQTIVEWIHKFQKELQNNSLSLGERVYAENPCEFVQRIKESWDVWHDHSKTLVEMQEVEIGVAKN